MIKQFELYLNTAELGMMHISDDRERNFSFIHSAQGCQLPPTYDLVTGMELSKYHAAGFTDQYYHLLFLKQKKRVRHLIDIKTKPVLQ